MTHPTDKEICVEQEIILETAKQELIRKNGMKFDGDKTIAGVLFEDFPHALEGIAKVATFGAKKYARSSWQTVPNAKQRYTDALVRHQIAKAKGEVSDPESGLPHSYHIAWNTLAIIQLEEVDYV